ncbi:hypothetical protein [Rhodovulum marinum]|uniref:Cytochrome c domain-containing protein n=1 Tax=Rhodovulum marinum TaxID=320662 RepID=A0A4V2SQP9_9RHOB|nr:hypothetical protein [Rhodovulum marinum]TCP39876.1 hypothetical protein EV662_1091 [Rhodovulum marinum]
MTRTILIAAALLAAGPAQSQEVAPLVERCISCHIDDKGQFDIVGFRALQALPEEWPLLFEDAYDLDGNGIAGRAQYVSGEGQPLIAKWGENLAAARFRDFALIAGAAHGIRIDDVAQIAEVEAAFAALSPDPVSPFETPEELTKFEADGCADCHVTRTYEVDGVTYMPLSDFLLHDLGDGEKRTAPLWGCQACISGNPHAEAR